MSTSFSGLTVENVPTSGPVVELKHVYFPATQTGYKFDYSAYGMIYNVSMRRQMTYDAGTGAIGDGVESSAVSFNYPTVASSLTDAPAFTQRTESANNSPTSAYTYSTTTDSVAKTKTFTVTRPDSSQVLLTRSTNGASVANGLLVQSEIKSVAGASMAKSVLAYMNDGGGSPQVQSVTSYDDTGTTAQANFDYDQYGNVTNLREFGFQIGGAWQVRRRSRTVYKTDAAYVNVYLRNLIVESDVYDALQNTNDADDVLIAKSTFMYDDYAAMGGMENYGGTAAPPGHDPNYDTTKTVRGNVTGTTQWIDIAENVSTTHLSKYDIFGNAVKAQVSCCNEKSAMLVEGNGWSQPEQFTTGDPSGLHLTTSSTDDYNTGLITSQADANALEASYSYDAALRPSVSTAPSGATQSASYNDGALSASSNVTYDDGGVSKTISSTTNADGWGRAIQFIAGNAAQVNTSYDAMGRVTSRTNPFPSGGSPGPLTSLQYDSLGRQTVVTLSDGTTVQNAYSSTAVTVTDQVNRKIKRETDGLGRLTKVTEQDATGALAQDTNYTYDLLDRLTQVNQGGQTRAWKYDGRGRLLYERIPEMSATINDGTGTMWSSKYTYTTFNAIETKTDARGVISSYGYDTLNRLTSISYNTSGAPGVASTPGVSYVYDNVDTSSTTGMLLSVQIGGGATAGGSEENYGYDSLRRVASVTQKIWVSAGVIRTYATSYQYNQGSQPTQMTYPSGRVLSIGHDNKGRVTSVGSYLTSVSYDNIGRVSGMNLGNGVTETYGYAANRMRLTSQTATKGATTLMSLTYGYQASAGQMGAGSTAGNAGQLISISGTIGGTIESASCAYDNLGRLVSSSQTTNGVSAQRRFEYDRWGNRTAMWDATSGGTQIQSIALQQSGGAPTNRITSVTNSGAVSNYTYDEAGNVTNDGAHSYTYDAENRLVSVDGGSTGQYGYDHQNERIKKTTAGVTTHYVWQNSQTIAEYNASNGVVQVEYVSLGGKMIAKVASGSTQFFLSDRLSVRVISDSAGNVIGRQAHLPFGEDFGESGSQEKHHFTGYERDSQIGSDYAVNRHYNNGGGRFNRPDPAGSSARRSAPQSWNRYGYVEDDPINKIDPLGLRLVCVLMPTHPVGDDGDIEIDEEWVCTEIPDGPRGTPGEQGGGGPVDKYAYCKAAVFGDSKTAGKLLIPTRRSANLSMKAADGEVNIAAMIAAIWSKESGVGRRDDWGYRPPGDHGPMQLTSWWWTFFHNAGLQNLILPGAYDVPDPTNGRNTSQPFSGKIMANVMTGANIIRYLYNEHAGNWGLMAEWYHGDDPKLTPKENEERRRKYREDVMSGFPQFQKFFDCMKNVQLPG